MIHHRIPMPEGIDTEMLMDCILIVGTVEVTADDPDWLTVTASTEGEAAAVTADAAEWIRRAISS